MWLSRPFALLDRNVGLAIFSSRYLCCVVFWVWNWISFFFFFFFVWDTYQCYKGGLLRKSFQWLRQWFDNQLPYAIGKSTGGHKTWAGNRIDGITSFRYLRPSISSQVWWMFSDLLAPQSAPWCALHGLRLLRCYSWHFRPCWWQNRTGWVNPFS